MILAIMVNEDEKPGKVCYGEMRQMILAITANEDEKRGKGSYRELRQMVLAIMPIEDEKPYWQSRPTRMRSQIKEVTENCAK